MMRASAASGGCERDVSAAEGNGTGPASRPASYSWTSSINVPNAVFGCTNATVVPRLPGPGCFVDHPVAVRLHRLERLRAVGDAVADVVDALALGREVLRDRSSRRGSA